MFLVIRECFVFKLSGFLISSLTAVCEILIFCTDPLSSGDSESMILSGPVTDNFCLTRSLPM